MSYYVETLDQVFLGSAAFVLSGFGLYYGAFSFFGIWHRPHVLSSFFYLYTIKTGNSVALQQLVLFRWRARNIGWAECMDDNTMDTPFTSLNNPLFYSFFLCPIFSFLHSFLRHGTGVMILSNHESNPAIFCAGNSVHRDTYAAW